MVDVVLERLELRSVCLLSASAIFNYGLPPGSPMNLLLATRSLVFRGVNKPIVRDCKFGTFGANKGAKRRETSGNWEFYRIPNCSRYNNLLRLILVVLLVTRLRG